MPRTKRKKSSTGIYHVLLSGINRQLLFKDKEDNEKFLDIINDCMKICKFKLYGYCLMSNHTHLLLKEGKEPLGQIFKRICARYVCWYNRKYNRIGHLFHDRYKSETVEDNKYFMTVLRYIHQNPTKAGSGINKSIEKYKWSSYNEYIRKADTDKVDFDFALEIIGKNNYIKFMSEKNEDKCLDYSEKINRFKDEELLKKIESKFRIKARMISNKPRKKMEQLLRNILKIEGVSTRQLARVTGVSANIIWGL